MIKKIVPLVFFTTVFLAPFSVYAQTTSGMTSWLSKIFNWKTPIVSRVSNIFEARKDNIESNNIARNRLLDWRQGVVPIDASSSDISSSTYSSSTISTDPGLEASTSPILIPYNVFEEKRIAIATELMTAENDLKTDESDLADFISDSSANGNDMTAAQNTLDQADAYIDSSSRAIDTFINYEPVVASSTDLIDLQIPQSYLDAAVTAIQNARDSLKSAISSTKSSLQ
jgi:hypothetical protein